MEGPSNVDHSYTVMNYSKNKEGNLKEIKNVTPSDEFLPPKTLFFNETADAIWPSEMGFHQIKYNKGGIIGEGGQKKCWEVDICGQPGKAVLLEYRYPHSQNDERFEEYKGSEKMNAFNEAFKSSLEHANIELPILKALYGSPNILQLQMVVIPKRDDYMKPLNAIVQYHNQGSLHQFLKKKKNFSKTEQFNIVSDLFTALQSTFNKGVFIADIKEENILLDDSTGRLRATVCDFGSSKMDHSLSVGEIESDLDSMLNLILYSIYPNDMESVEARFILNEKRNLSNVKPAEILYRWLNVVS